MKKIANQLKALGEENRLKIISCLSNKHKCNSEKCSCGCGSEKCVCDIMECLNIPQNLLSHHLKILRENNLIILRKQGKWSHYSINREELDKIKEFLNF